MKMLTAGALLALSSGALANLSWSFDADAEGWGTLNDAELFTWDGAVGNPAGAIRARDQGLGDIWYFAAPAVVAGNRAALYGETISWDILGLRGSQTSIPDRADVMLVGGGLEIGIDADVQPLLLSGWTSWSVEMSVADDWRIISDIDDGDLSATVATEAQILSVLSDLEGLYIRGEYTNVADDEAAIDNVIITPTPGAAALLAIAGLCAASRRRG